MEALLRQKVHDWNLLRKLEIVIGGKKNFITVKALEQIQVECVLLYASCILYAFLQLPEFDPAAKVRNGSLWPQQYGGSSSHQFYLVKGIVCTQKSGL